MEQILLTVAEAAKVMRISIHTVNAWRAAGKGPRPTRLGTRVFYRPQDIQAFIDASVQPEAKAKEPRQETRQTVVG
jgi:predicted site-specific integrase-resolvase